MKTEDRLKERAIAAAEAGDPALAGLLEQAAAEIAVATRVVALPTGVQMTPPMLRRALELVAPEGTHEEEDAVVVLQVRTTGGGLGTFAYPHADGPARSLRLDAPSLEERLAAEGPCFDAAPAPVTRLQLPVKSRAIEPSIAPVVNSGLANALIDSLAHAFRQGQARPLAGDDEALAVAEDILLGEECPEDPLAIKR